MNKTKTTHIFLKLNQTKLNQPVLYQCSDHATGFAVLLRKFLNQCCISFHNRHEIITKANNLISCQGFLVLFFSGTSSFLTPALLVTSYFILLSRSCLNSFMSRTCIRFSEPFQLYDAITNSPHIVQNIY